MLFNHGSKVLSAALHSLNSNSGPRSCTLRALLPVLLAVFVRLELQINQVQYYDQLHNNFLIKHLRW
jgi:hypothetical protein